MMKPIVFYLPVFLGSIFVACHDAQAAATCAPFDQIAARLDSAFGERLHRQDIAANGTVSSIFVAPATGSWTITTTKSGQLTCLSEAGQAFDIKYRNTSLRTSNL
ncbi:hypothetical protein [Loktanella sp. S4079]|uniref:hypothetical protein n=1 Tax=Loktanella sp. S4079 TaxID=579483 RepID=UPI0006978E3F|nr:hypothetical protein [Loktanella sp. S4079]